MCCRGGEIDYDAIDTDKKISNQLRTDKKKLNDEIRLLLLGAGESGKSTILKQMKILHSGGFNPEEKHDHILLIHVNIWESVQNIVKASHTLNMPLSPELEDLCQIFLEPFSKLITPELGKRIYQFWKDESVLQIFERKSEYQILDNTSYFVANLMRICEKDYVPTELDILSVRCQTTGVTETTFISNGKKFVMVDVGGQRSERKKWIHCFEDVMGVLFCVGISAFDQTLYEDNQTNRLKEDLKLFQDICVSKWFSSTAIILFLNKSDIFKEKLVQGKSISDVFPEFKGGSDYKNSVVFLREKFMDIVDPVTKRKKDVFCHVTTATDTENVRYVFDDVREYIIHEIFKRAGLM